MTVGSGHTDDEHQADGEARKGGSQNVPPLVRCRNVTDSGKQAKQLTLSR